MNERTLSTKRNSTTVFVIVCGIIMICIGITGLYLKFSEYYYTRAEGEMLLIANGLKIEEAKVEPQVSIVVKSFEELGSVNSSRGS